MMKKNGIVCLLLLAGSGCCFCQQTPVSALTNQMASGSWAIDSLSWEFPIDGGTPRDLSRISRIAPYLYHIQASFEDGGESVLKHAISRVDLSCVNHSSRPIQIKVRIDLSGDGKRTDYDTKPESGMKLRDFLFLRSNGKSWRQINGHTEGWVSVISLTLEPGLNNIGLSPWYGYLDYLNFIKSLPESKYLQKRMIGHSDGNREHWELIVTDTTVSRDQKQTIFWQAREHSYETFSSYAMEGLIPYLLSDSCAQFRKHYELTIHPMSNIDGVANGFEYRAGYDFPDPAKTKTGQLTFGTMDRLKPDYAVAWHNWVAPRDRNVVFYTDADSGKATERAWLRFTQLFPSLRQWAHRWKDEQTPMIYNWKAKPGGGNNVHSYGIRTYGTHIWGWEMPWWNFTVEEVRQAGASFGLAFLTTLDEIRFQSVPEEKLRPEIRSPQYKMIEWTVSAKSNLPNPYQQAMIVGEFRSPEGKIQTVDGFYNGNDQWKIRFTPELQGNWSYLLRGEGVTILESGNILCTAPEARGFIRKHPSNNYAFGHSDSSAFFPMGDTNYGLYDDSPITPALREAYLKKRKEQGFNYIRMEVGHSYQHALADNRYWAWGGTVEKPDFESFNPDFFKGLDSLFWRMQQTGMNAELILLNFYRLPFTDTSLWTPKRERIWLHYLMSRYAAFPNIFMWTLSNEYETHPDGKYRLDSIGDLNWVRSTAAYLRQNDPYRHLITVHPVISSSSHGESPLSAADQPWRIGGFFGMDSSIDVLSQQTGQHGKNVRWDKSCPCWIGDDPQLTASIAIDRVFDKPVINSESGYEYLKEQPTMKNQVHHTDKVRRSAWRIVCSGGYFAAGFSGTIGHNDIWNELDPPHHYRFILKDEGAGNQLKYLFNFFSALPYWEMEPLKQKAENLLEFASLKREIRVLYFPHGGKTTMTSSDSIRKYRWFNPRTGIYLPTMVQKARSAIELKTPDSQDWVLLITGSRELPALKK